jgi:hypothetical protein
MESFGPGSFIIWEIVMILLALVTFYKFHAYAKCYAKNLDFNNDSFIWLNKEDNSDSQTNENQKTNDNIYSKMDEEESEF